MPSLENDIISIMNQISKSLKNSYFCLFLTGIVGLVILFTIIARNTEILLIDAPITEKNKTRERAELIRDLALAWLIKNVRGNGLFTYSVNPETGEYSTSNNELRQLMSSRILAERSANNVEIMKLHEKNLKFVITNWYREENGIGYILYENKSKLGANAMFLRTLSASPHLNQYAKIAAATARGILALQNSDGSFRPWLKAPDYEFDSDYLLTFYSGEAILALVEYFERSEDRVYLNAALASSDFYIKKYTQELERNYYPAYVPWHTVSYAKLYKITNDPKFTEAIFILNDKLLELQDTKNEVGRFFNPATPQYGMPHSSSDGIFTEGLVYAFEIASLVNDTNRKERYKKSIELSLKNIQKLQYRAPLPNSKLPFETYRGGIQTNIENPWTRIDNAQHVIDAIDHFLKLETE